MALTWQPVRRSWFMAVPSLIVALPFSGLSLQYDEVKLFVSTANTVRGNPLLAVEHSIRDIDRFLDLGTFRPLGRFLENSVYSAMFETSEATGLAPHALQGVVRLIMVAALAYAATRVVAALMRSAGVRPDHPALLIYPIVLATTLVANGSVSPLVLFPLLFTGSVVFVLAVALVVARDRDMQPRSLQRHEPGAMALLGAAAAMTYDLVYVAPILAAVFIVSRATAARMTVSEVLRLAAARRWMYLSLGFLVVFAPPATRRPTSTPPWTLSSWCPVGCSPGRRRSVGITTRISARRACSSIWSPWRPTP